MGRITPELPPEQLSGSYLPWPKAPNFLGSDAVITGATDATVDR